MKKIDANQFVSAQEIAVRWGMNRSSIGRIMRRYGRPGLKFGPSQVSLRKWNLADVLFVEIQARTQVFTVSTKRKNFE